MSTAGAAESRADAFSINLLYRSTITLSASHVESLLAQHLGNPADTQRRYIVEKKLKEVAEYFLPDVVLQSLPTPAESMRKLKRIEDAAHRLLNALNVDDSTRLWLRQGLVNYRDIFKLEDAVSGIRFLEQVEQEAQAIIASKKNPKRKGPPSAHALRVAVHRLALCWMHAFGKEPGAGFDPDEGIPDGPVIRFARAFFEAMRQCASAEQMNEYPQLKRLLNPSRHTIRKYLQAFKRRLKGNAGRSK